MKFSADKHRPITMTVHHYGEVLQVKTSNVAKTADAAALAERLERLASTDPDAANTFSYSLVVALLGGTLPLVATWLEASLGLTQGPALYCLIWAVPTLLAYRQLERHLLPD